MRGRCLYVLAVRGVLLACLSPAAAHAEPTNAAEAARLSRRLDALFRAGSSRGTMTMAVVTPHFQRNLTLEVLSRGLDDTRVVIAAPAKERGTATLKRGPEMWNYLPKVDKTVRIPPSMMMGSWMGSDLTHDDLMRASSWERDYTVQFVGGPQPPSQLCLQYVPRPRAAVTWSRVVACLDRTTEIPLVVEYFDEQGRKARAMSYGDVRELGGRRVPTTWTLLPLLPDRAGHRTVIQLTAMEWEVPVTDDDFSLAALRVPQVPGR